MIGDVKWDQVKPMTMSGFLDRFTLHDSAFNGLNIDNDGSVIVKIGFDLVWNSSIPKGYDTLVFRFERPYRVRWVHGAWAQCTLSGAESALLEPTTRIDLLNHADFDPRAYQGQPDEILHPAFDETLTCTQLQFVNWTTLEILHGGSVRIIVIDSEAKTIDVSTIKDGVGHQ